MHGRVAREQNQRRRRLAEVLDAKRDAIGLDRRHEAGAGAMSPMSDGRARGFWREEAAHRKRERHPDGFRAQCPANAATTGASVSAEPAPKTK